MEPMALASVTQRSPPLQLNFMSAPIQLLLAGLTGLARPSQMPAGNQKD